MRSVGDLSGHRKRCKAVASRAFDLAIDEGVDLWQGNPPFRTPLKRADSPSPTALTPADIAELRRRVAAWQTAYKRTDLIGIVDTIIATRVRPSELFALRWEDVDLSNVPATLTVAGSMTTLRGKRTDGKGLQRRDRGKSDNSFRTMALPSWCAAMLMERMVSRTSKYVFPNENGGLLSRSNVATRWRQARGEDYLHVTLQDVPAHSSDHVGAWRVGRYRGVAT